MPFFRHNRIILALASLLILTVGNSCSSLDIFTGQSRRPNILLIITDDQPLQSIAYMPNVQGELIGQGVEFTNAYATTPLCCPSRASILTGLYAHNHNVLTNRPPQGGATAFDDSSTLALWLQEAGYHTALIGKYLNNYDGLEPFGYVPPGWDVWDAFLTGGPNNRGFYYSYTMSDNGKVVQYADRAEDYSTDVVTKRALEFIRDKQNRPFLLILSYYAPHQTYLPAPRHKDLFKTEAEFSLHRPPNYYESDITDKPEWLTTMPPVEAEHVDGVYQRILRSLMSVDESVGQITDLLEEKGMRENTLILYTSDNGMSLGENTVFGKNCPYETCLKIPFIVSYPALISRPSVSEDFVLNIDIAPTIAELAGVTIPGEVDGLSFMPLLRKEETTWRDAFLFEHFQELDTEEEGLTSAIPTFHGVRTPDWKYVEYESGEKELYDLVNDPFEMENLIYDSSNADIVSSLQMQLRDLKQK